MTTIHNTGFGDYDSDTQLQRIRGLRNDTHQRLPVVFVPKWYEQIAKIHKIPLQQLFTPEGFKKYLSYEERAMILSAQLELDWMSVLKSDNEVDATYYDGYHYLCDSVGVERAIANNINRIYIEMLHERLQAQNAASTDEPITVHQTQEALFFIVQPNHLDFTKSTPTIAKWHQIRALEAILKQLYAYLTRDVVHSTVWYGMYVDLMAETVYATLDD